jgi:hypothetical protein
VLADVRTNYDILLIRSIHRDASKRVLQSLPADSRWHLLKHCRLGLNRLHSFDPPSPVVRYEHPYPRDLVPFDLKRMAGIVKPGPSRHRRSYLLQSLAEEF